MFYSSDQEKELWSSSALAYSGRLKSEYILFYEWISSPLDSDSLLLHLLLSSPETSLIFLLLSLLLLCKIQYWKTDWII